MAPTNSDREVHPLLKLVDPRMPLPWVVGIIVLAVGMYFKLQSLADAVVELQTTVRSGNASWSSLSSGQELLKFRMSTAEADLERLRAAVAGLQAGRRP